jgi:hypothetical protein
MLLGDADVDAPLVQHLRDAGKDVLYSEVKSGSPIANPSATPSVH